MSHLNPLWRSVAPNRGRRPVLLPPQLLEEAARTTSQADGPGPPGATKHPRVLHRKPILCGGIVWVRRKLNGPKRRFLARAVARRAHGDGFKRLLAGCAALCLTALVLYAADEAASYAVAVALLSLPVAATMAVVGLLVECLARLDEGRLSFGTAIF
jgi:hypothetical protein